MGATNNPSNGSAERFVSEVRRRYTTEDKIRVVLRGLRGEENIAELCRQEQINRNSYYQWSKAFLEAGARRLSGKTNSEVNRNSYYQWSKAFLEAGARRLSGETGSEVKALHSQTVQLKEMLTEMTLENRLLKQSVQRLHRSVRG